ncbi:MAG: hypothetical protein EZS28_048070 [Streblomastix strix]|uniref:Uncharacterized protein n=1 Tax=Streblomastix strix TaxID=222440 RepID=A0A5J4TF47_9EUKA|nr:MAG: hypothetical protein EZS28_048070 [Streblomastix strix]
MFRLKRRSDLFQLNQIAAPIISSKDSEQTWIAGLGHLRRQAVTNSNPRGKISQLDSQFFRRSDINDNIKKNRDSRNSFEVEENIATVIIKENQVLDQHDRQDQFPQTLAQTRGISYEDIQLNEKQSNVYIQMEGLFVDEQKSITRNILVDQLSQNYQANQSYNTPDKSHSENGCLRRRMWNRVGNIEFENEDQREWEMDKRKLATDQFESEGDCRYPLRDTQARTLFNRCQNQQSEERDRQRGRSLQHQERSSSNSSQGSEKPVLM